VWVVAKKPPTGRDKQVCPFCLDIVLNEEIAVGLIVTSMVMDFASIFGKCAQGGGAMTEFLGII